jgi:alpha-galactosidase
LLPQGQLLFSGLAGKNNFTFALCNCYVNILAEEEMKAKYFITIMLFLIYSAGAIFAQKADTVYLNSLDISQIQQGWGEPQKDKSVDGNPLRIGNQNFKNGVGTHAKSIFKINLAGGTERFLAYAGLDAENGANNKGSVNFEITGDGKTLWKSEVLKPGMAAVKVDISLKGVKQLVLIVNDGGDNIDYDHADWVDAKFVVKGAKPKAVTVPKEKPYLLTPKESPKPKINGAKVFGVRAGSPFMYTIPATGKRPMKFDALNLPAGLSLDKNTGIITGVIEREGEYSVTFKAKNSFGEVERGFKIFCGDKIALTPPLGWNSWNCFAGDVTADKIKSAADAMVKSGLINHGWTYINIDDCWMVKPGSKDPMLSGDMRDKNGMVLTNKHFPDMKGLSDYIHSKGLKIGIYSSPGTLTCAGYTGSLNFEKEDAIQWANWGIDYVKYDWCSYSRVAKDNSLPELKKPYDVMRKALNGVKRDIVYSLCQYGMGNVWEWGEAIGGNAWRTTGDITDSWNSVENIGFSQAGKEKYAGPGHWNDPDMLVVGKVGWGPQLHNTKLTPSEQYTHITLWSLLCSPLLIGCDMTQMDDFTLNLLTNDEVIEVNQDPLGKQAARVFKDGNIEVWMKELEDGSIAAGLFNRGEEKVKVSVKLSDLKLTGKFAVRDLWRQKNTDTVDKVYKCELQRHGAELIKLTKTK